MARLLKQSQAKKLGLPGRTSLEPISGEIGSRVSFRIAEIAVPKPGDPPRGPHLHRGFEECIYVLRGTGVTVAESGEIPIQPGDIVLIPAYEKHMTRNTGSEPLVLLCFFAEPNVTLGTTELKSFCALHRPRQPALRISGSCASAKLSHTESLMKLRASLRFTTAAVTQLQQVRPHSHARALHDPRPLAEWPKSSKNWREFGSRPGARV